MAVSLIQSNASGFGSWLVEPSTGINLHNRGLGFSLEPGHPAELRPGRRPPHTLSPAIATQEGAFRAVFGTMGGDAQPQILLQLAARLFHHGQRPAQAVEAARWALRGRHTGFDTWTSDDGPLLAVEGHAPDRWPDDLAGRGHAVRRAAAYDSEFGHAHVIMADGSGGFVGAADPRARVGAVAAI
jgi:gamma-glutamyltranspeptidase / glutathione hydrolase